MRSVVHVFCVEKMYGVEYEKHHIPLQIRDAIDERLCHEQFGEKEFGTDKDVIDRSFLKEQICKQMNENIAEWAKIL